MLYSLLVDSHQDFCFDHYRIPGSLWSDIVHSIFSYQFGDDEGGIGSKPIRLAFTACEGRDMLCTFSSAGSGLNKARGSMAGL